MLTDLHPHDDCGQKTDQFSKKENKNKEKRIANGINVFHAACSNDVANK